MNHSSMDMLVKVDKFLEGVEDMLGKVDKFTFPTDFVIMDMEEDGEVPLILERPFMRIPHALIDMNE